MNQRKYCLELLNDYGMLGCKPIGTPIEANMNVQCDPSDKDGLFKNITEYQKLVGRVLRYLKVAPGKGVQFVKSEGVKMHAYSDSEYAKCKMNRKSVTGKKQATISRSSAETEYKALGSAACEIVWIKDLLFELNINVELFVNLFCDNNSALQLVANTTF
ncbi:uncharacterized mitochondrial protein AtMg00810-like [Rutidosis leptorrhynchoides]|uniref:uncharacterized mitochondrial protein AtMg00810-like n=1 Tax=Rutidosis leptorrhynchoides TaxID=125765 RepID=UPI003A99BE73